MFLDMDNKCAITTAVFCLDGIVVNTSSVIIFVIECDSVAQTKRIVNMLIVIGGVSGQDQHMR